MKENILFVTFPVLLLASSSLLSQPDNSPPVNTLQTGMMLANVNPDVIHGSNAPIGDIFIKKPEKAADTALPKTVHPPVNGAGEDTIGEDRPGNAETRQVELKQYSDEELARMRTLFIQAEKAVKHNNKAKYLALSEQLADYPLQPFLQYQWLRKHLNDEEQIQGFLQQNSSSRYASKLKYKWLHYLGRHKQWSLLLQHRMTTKDTSLNCYFHRAELQAGNEQAALMAAQKLWAVGRSQPRACDPLFSQLKKSDLFTQDLRWQRFNAALQHNKVTLASYVKTLMPEQYQATAQLWLNLHRHPARYMDQFLASERTEQSALMFTHAISRLAGKDLDAAIKIWDANKQQYMAEESLAAKQARDKLEKRLAFKLVFEKDSTAYERLSQLNVTDKSSRTWRVRAALLEQNWQNVITAIHDLSEAEKQQEKWQYWLARADLETGKVEQAERLFTSLAQNRSFYGYLAADKVNSIYQLSDNPVDVSAAEITELKNRREFRVAFELKMLDRKNEAKLQWWHATRSLDKKEILVAAKLAQQWQWDEIAIFTIAKAKYWDDIEVRFPISYADKILENSAQNNLNPVILYGLIRRESAFNEKAHSPTGARGLMQIMPRTGRDIARHLNERWHGSNSLYNPVTNLKYGSYYYQKLLDRFDGHYAIALAAYNAGPERVKRWLPQAGSIPADIWIETIPYRETREYVTSVLTYALIYQQRINSSELSMNDFTRNIQPLMQTP